MSSNKFLFIILTVAVLPSVFSIKCYQCNSANNTDCNNLPVYKSMNIRSIEPTECVGDFQGQEPFCKKTVLDTSDNDDNWHPRMIRSCGYMKSPSDCYRYDNEDHEEQVCQCFEDGCNSAHSTVPINAVMFLVILTIFKCICL